MSIIIHNESGDPKGVCTYRIYINNTPIASFRHDRKRGLAECLREAARAVAAGVPDEKKGPAME